MIRGEKYYFFRLNRFPNDDYPVYRVAKSIADLRLRLGDFYVNEFYSITQLNEVTAEHIRAITLFLTQNIS